MNTTTQVEATQAKTTREQIAQLAYQLWEKSGRQPGHDLDFWLQAEKQIQATPAPAPAQPIAAHPGSRQIAQTRSTGSNHTRRAGNNHATRIQSGSRV